MKSPTERNRAIEQLVREERGRILGFLTALRVPPSHREDLLQTGLVLLLQKWDAVDDPFPWLLGALRNLHRTHVRNQSRKDRLFLPFAPSEALPMRQISATSCTSDLRIDLSRWLLALSRQQRVLVVGLVLLGDPPCEVARRAGVKPDSVRTLKSRSLKKLRCLAGRNSSPHRRLGGG